MARFISFKLGLQTWGIDVLVVREINQLQESTPVQLAPPYIHGLINLRGQIVTVLDLAKRIDYAFADDSSDKYNIILKSGQEINAIAGFEENHGIEKFSDIVGLRVDTIGDLIDVHDKKIEPPPANISEAGAGFVSGVYNLKTELLLVLNLEKVLNFT